jgi:hypothetical protein
MKTMFMHFRQLNSYDQVSDPRGGATVAFCMVGNSAVKIASAYCSRKEVFDRKLGRAIALGRLETDRQGSLVTQFDIDSSRPIREQVARFVSPVMEKMGYE